MIDKRLLKTALAAAIIILPCSVQAQQQAMRGGVGHHRHFAQGMNSGAFNAGYQNGSTARTAVIASSRLVAEEGGGYNGGFYTPMDSVAYSYTGTKGGYIDEYGGWHWQFDSSYDYSYAGSGYSVQHKDIQTFDANNNITSEVELVWNAPTSSWINYSMETNAYDAANNRITSKDETWDTGTNSWDSTREYVDSFGSGHSAMLEEVELEWNTSAGGWENTYRFSDTYDLSDNLVSTLTETWNGTSGGWVNNYKGTNVYNASNDRLSTTGQTWSAAWTNSYRYIYGNFVNHQAQTQVYQTWNGAMATFDSSTKTNYTYNSYNQPTYYYEQNWNAGSNAWEIPSNYPDHHYYYELYAAAVPEISNDAASIAVYPVPAKNELSVDIVWDKPQAFSVTLMDVAGRMYTRQNIPACTQYADKLSLADVPSGNYVVVIEGAEGKVTRKISVVK